MKWQTTYVCRENTNERLLAAVDGELKERQKVKLFSEAYIEGRTRLLGHILRLTGEQEEKTCTLYADIPYLVINPTRRVGLPRYRLAQEAMRWVWEVEHDLGASLAWEPYEMLNFGRRDQMQTIDMLAHLRLI